MRDSAREAAYAAIDTERDYQESKWGGSASSGEPGAGRSIDEFALYIQGYANDLANVAAHTLDATEKLNFVRKVGGLAVACMEQHGAPHRFTEEELRSMDSPS